MMNKPKGVISASNGRGELHVTDILPDDMKRKNLFPAGRLDIDTTGFVLITDNGELAHKILSPKNHIPKTYIAVLDKPFDNVLADEFKIGVELDGKKMPACRY
ncbi:MAG: pseudouridine synthase [Clostridiales bacterium]|nr:pseudouridine synthase [Clostridiales bacterium]